MVCPEAIKQTQAMENQITRHFVHLHGVLQNLEQELRNKLREQRKNLQRDVEEFRSTLADEAEKLASACAVNFENFIVNLRFFFYTSMTILYLFE